MIKKEIKMNKNKEKSFLLIHNYLTIEAENFKEKVQAKKFKFLFISRLLPKRRLYILLSSSSFFFSTIYKFTYYSLIFLYLVQRS